MPWVGMDHKGSIAVPEQEPVDSVVAGWECRSEGKGDLGGILSLFSLPLRHKHYIELCICPELNCHCPLSLREERK